MLQNDCTLVLRRPVFGRLFLLGSLSLNSFKISLQKEKEFLGLRSTKDNPRTIFFFYPTSCSSFASKSAVLTLTFKFLKIEAILGCITRFWRLLINFF